jgi:hypothetical protein
LEAGKGPALRARLVLCDAATTDRDLAESPLPDVVFQSKPDVHDPRGSLQAYLNKFQYQPIRRLPAFTIWTTNGSDVERLFK